MGRPFNYKHDQQGAITLWVVVFLVIFAIILMSSLQFVTRQSHATIVQEQEEQAFAAAEAGIHEALWLLNSGKASSTAALKGMTVDKEITNAAGDVLAKYTLAWPDHTADAITVESTGRDIGNPQVCQVVEARLTKVAAGGFVITSWEHVLATKCHATALLSPVGGSGSVTAIPILLNGSHDSALTVPNEIKTYEFTADAKAKIRIMVQASTFTPQMSLYNSAGTHLAEANGAMRLAHVRFEARLRHIQDTLMAQVGGATATSCGFHLYNACIPHDVNVAYFELPNLADTYQIRLQSAGPQIGSYKLSTEKKP